MSGIEFWARWIFANVVISGFAYALYRVLGLVR